MNLGKVIRLIFQSNFDFSLINDCFYMSEILVNEKNIVFSIKVMYNLIKTNGNNNIKQMNKKNKIWRI